MVSMIVAASENGVIGRANQLPWRLSRDLKNFKECTTGHTVIMGRKTFESIFARLGKPLPDRKNVVVTTNADFKADGCVIVHSIEEAIEQTKGEEVFVIGGETIYRQALPFTDRLLLTTVHTTLEGDAKMPDIHFDEWDLLSQEEWPKDEKNEYDATYQMYERKQ
ncbi:MAG TPA: dihydrofolate reductase [Verrucomicrobiae bacterium]|nr:dihydrofolate reductase [Verrucomicrobiae bacterium]